MRQDLVSFLFRKAKENKIIGCGDLFVSPQIMSVLSKDRSFDTTDVDEKYLKRGDLILFLKERKTLEEDEVELRDMDFSQKFKV